MNPLRAKDPYDWSALLRLIRTSFAYMDGRIDPPSSMHQLTVDTLRQTAT
ncbi:MAG: N-acetyltransferase, partial [Rhodovulum sp.]|nr:N-acetyltransferase [Rhodovulum sp.]